MNILSLFDGISCLYMALLEAEIAIDNYFASEIDKYCIRQTAHNFPNVKQVGDVRHLEVDSLPHIDFLGGGSPCTDLSFAGRQDGLIYSDLDSYLELRAEYLRTGNESLYFIKGKGGKPKLQQSILFWEYVRILHELKKLNPDVKFLLENVSMDKKQKKIISDTLGAEPMRLNSNRVSAQNRDRFYWQNFCTRPFDLFGRLRNAIPQPKDRGLVINDILQDESKVDESYYVTNPKWLKTIFDPVRQKKKFVQIGGKKAICIKTGDYSRWNGNYVIVQRPHGYNKGGVFHHKSPTVTASSWECSNYLTDGCVVRKLTERECSRLQTIPDSYEWIVSENQAYKAIGNGNTVESLVWILKHL